MGNLYVICRNERRKYDAIFAIRSAAVTYGSTVIILLCRRFVLIIFQYQLPSQHYNTSVVRVYCLSGTLYGVFRVFRAVSSPCPTTVEDSRSRSVVGLARLTALRSRGVHEHGGRRRVAGCAGGYPGVFPNNTAPHPPAASVTAIRTNTCLSGTAHTA